MAMCGNYRQIHYALIKVPNIFFRNFLHSQTIEGQTERNRQ